MALLLDLRRRSGSLAERMRGWLGLGSMSSDGPQQKHIAGTTLPIEEDGQPDAFDRTDGTSAQVSSCHPCSVPLNPYKLWRTLTQVHRLRISAHTVCAVWASAELDEGQWGNSLNVSKMHRKSVRCRFAFVVMPFGYTHLHPWASVG